MVEVVAALGVGLALVYVRYADLGLPKFFAITAGLFLLYNPIKQISRVHMQIQKCRAASANVFALLALQPTVQDAPGAIDLPACQGDIRFEQLSFRYEAANAYALKQFSLHIAPGKSVALVGESGAGKSTLLALLQRFYDPGSGAVLIDGRDVRTLTQRSLREQIGVVTQDTFLFHDSIYENIRYGRLDASEAEIREAARQAYIHDFIMTLPDGYETRIGDKGARLSGGQQQRLAIARALLKDAPILLLDEATSALDSESERMIQIALEILAKGRTVISIAHRLSTILKADQIIVLDAGEIVEQGRHAELYAKGGRYRRLYDLQFDHEAHLHEIERGVPAEVPAPDETTFLRPMNVPTV
jgi:subfamily B ATP-binding cassette protein MsbA